MEVTRKSILTGKTHTLEIDVTPEQLDSWRAGTNIQSAAPGLSAADREFIISGITSEEWDLYMRSDDEGEDQ